MVTPASESSLHLVWAVHPLSSFEEKHKTLDWNSPPLTFLDSSAVRLLISVELKSNFFNFFIL